MVRTKFLARLGRSGAQLASTPSRVLAHTRSPIALTCDDSTVDTVTISQVDFPFEVRADKTVLYRVEDSCGEYVSESTYVWESIDERTILVTSANGGWIDGTYKMQFTAGESCDQLVVEHFTSNVSLYEYFVYRGALCLFAGNQQCFTSWCDDAPEPCDEDP